jgi:hypothetical protein
MAAQFPKLQIVWRNRQTVRRRHRSELLEVGSNSSLYAIQEFLPTGEHGFWNTTWQLQIISSTGCAVTGNWRLRSVELIWEEK